MWFSLYFPHFRPLLLWEGFNGLDYTKETDTTDHKDTGGYTRILRITRIPTRTKISKSPK